MNFKPTLWKTIISIIIGAIGIFLIFSIIYTGDSILRFVFNMPLIYVFLILFVVTYIIWSLFQKRGF